MNRIYVFTSTGNSLKLAKTMAKGLGNTEILSMARLMQREEWSIEGEIVGFIFPGYYGSVPQLVTRFIGEARNIQADYIFSMISAGRSTGIAMKTLAGQLEERNLRLNYGRSLMLASNYMSGWYYSMVIPGEEKLNQLYEQAEQSCRRAIEDIKERKDFLDRSSFIGYLLPLILSPSRYTRDTRPWDREFSIGDQCSGCGTCVKACPVDNIYLDQGKPKFNHNCQRCMGCVQLCPQQAFFIEGKAMNKPQYLHAEISRKELFQFHGPVDQ
ncbi:MAG: EFR1 family ferrodoxin [Spirochaetaceae bacterium]|nr:EFR1 family ferrodoxin [Spirochaetaceae bacterium]